MRFFFSFIFALMILVPLSMRAQTVHQTDGNGLTYLDQYESIIMNLSDNSEPVSHAAP